MAGLGLSYTVYYFMTDDSSYKKDELYPSFLPDPHVIWNSSNENKAELLTRSFLHWVQDAPLYAAMMMSLIRFRKVSHSRTALTILVSFLWRIISMQTLASLGLTKNLFGLEHLHGEGKCIIYSIEEKMLRVEIGILM